MLAYLFIFKCDMKLVSQANNFEFDDYIKLLYHL